MESQTKEKSQASELLAFKRVLERKTLLWGKPDFQFSIHRMGLGGHLDLFKTRKEGM